MAGKTLNKRIGISGDLVNAIYKSSVLHFMSERTIDLVISLVCSELIPFFRAIKAIDSIQVDAGANFHIGHGEQGKWTLPVDVDTNYREHPQDWIIDSICDQALLPRIESDDWFGLFSYILPNKVTTRDYSIFIGDIEEKELTATILSELYGLKTYFWNKEKDVLENALLAKECFYRLVPCNYQAALLTVLGISSIIERVNDPIARGTSHINDGVHNHLEADKDIFELPKQPVCKQNSSFYQVAEQVDCLNPGAERAELAPSVCICIPTICCADFLKELVENILPQLRPDEKVYIVDNGNQGVDQMFDPNLVKVMISEKNLGVSGSWNKLIKTAFAECPDIAWALVLNDDIQLAQKQLRKIRQELFFSEKAGKWFVVGPYEWSVFAIHRLCVEAVGYFDEEIFPAFREDDDYHYRIHLTDPDRYKIAGKALDPEIKRKRTSTTRRPELNIWHKNRDYYLKKWGGDPGQEIFKDPFGSYSYSVRSDKSDITPGMKLLVLMTTAQNQKDSIERALNSLKVTCPMDTQFSIWHNGELEPEMRDYLLSLKDYNLMTSTKDIGWGAVNNYHLSSFNLDHYNYILFTNSDIEYHPGWFGKTTTLLEKYSRIGVLAVRKNIDQGLWGRQYPDLVCQEKMPGGGWLFKTSRLRELLPFPEQGEHKMAEETRQFCAKTRKKGYIITAPAEDMGIPIDVY